MKVMARFKPPLAASAADKVVLGPGVKAMAVENTSRAANSEEVMKE
jgi:hypothetical protein